MKILTALLFALLLLAFSGETAFAQYKKLTVILLRHAEKDVSESADTMNPELSEAGKLRARKLIDAIDKYAPEAIYSTEYIRTRETARPLARKRRAMIQLYDGRNLGQMRDLILSGRIKRLVVVGHADTTPALLNALLGAEKYKRLNDAEYDKIFVVRIRRYKRKPHKVEEKMIVY